MVDHENDAHDVDDDDDDVNSTDDGEGDNDTIDRIKIVMMMGIIMML